MNRLALYEDYQTDLAYECNDCQNHEILIDGAAEFLDEIIDQVYNLKDLDPLLLHHSIAELASYLNRGFRMKDKSEDGIWLKNK